MAEKLTDKEIEEKMNELKIEMLKQPTKRKIVKREIARLLTARTQNEQKAKLTSSITRTIKSEGVKNK